MAWSTMRYRSRRPLQEALRGRLRAAGRPAHVRYGYRRLTVLLRREGWAVNAKRIYPAYDEEQLKVRSVERKKIRTAAAGWRNRQPRLESGPGSRLRQR